MSNDKRSNNHGDKHKTAEELQSQWASGRDSWKDVPIIPSSSSSDTINIQTKIKEELSPEQQLQLLQNKKATQNGGNNDSVNDWPEIIMKSILYGFGAYNPRGQILPDDINKKQHLLLQNDIQMAIEQDSKLEQAIWWQGASRWSDGSSERGFIVAIPIPKTKEIDDDDSHDEYVDVDLKYAHDYIVNLAKKYDQGAIYKFEYMNGKLMRDTIAVLDEGTDARVEVLRDYNEIDLSIFS